MNQFQSLSLFLIFILPHLTWAHDTWIVPDHYRVDPEKRCRINHRIGMNFPVSLNAPTQERIVDSVVIGLQFKHSLTHYLTEGKSLVSEVTFNQSGSYMVGTTFKPAEIKMTADKFNRYLLHDGLSHIHALRKKKGLLNQDAIEHYTKLPKSLIQVGQKTDPSILNPIGLKLEIIPLQNPYRLQAGEQLEIKVLYKGQSLPLTDVSWSYPGQGHHFAGTRKTNQHGIVQIPLEQSGPYVIRLVHMEHVQKPTHEWESYWASLTFEVNQTQILNKEL